MRDKIEKFYREELRNCRGRVGARGFSPQDVEDIVQESFARALRYQDSYDSEHQELGAWFNKILNNVCKDVQRANRTMSSYTIDDFDEERVQDKDVVHEDKMLCDRIEQLINKKSSPQKDILYLYYIRGYMPREIMAVLDVKRSEVKGCCYRFKQEMQNRYGELFE